jgi:uncharacterized membrane protein YfcA
MMQLLEGTQMPWAVIGWPVLSAATAAFGVAFLPRFRWAGLAGALIATPLCLYLKDLPFLHWTSLVALAANFVSAALLWRGRRDIAFALLLPFMCVIALIAIFWVRDFSVFRGLRL